MAQLQWSENLVLGMPQVDQTHQEFVALLATVASAPEAQLRTLYLELLAHTKVHFGMEDQWMQATEFASFHCHSMQHTMVLDVMQQALDRYDEGDLEVLRIVAHELGLWFEHHADAMDAALVGHLIKIGFDATTGSINNPEALARASKAACGEPDHACASTQEASNAKTQAETIA